jgi:hypothetical protein
MYDELHAPHWQPQVEDHGNRERDEVRSIMQDVEDIRPDPEGFAQDEEAELDTRPLAKKVARAYWRSLNG